MGRFQDVAGQGFVIDRPPVGHLSVVDHNGRACGVSLELIRSESVTLSHVLEQQLKAAEGNELLVIGNLNA